MGLMKSDRNSDGLYIDPFFDKSQEDIWTSDLSIFSGIGPVTEKWQFFVSFEYGSHSSGGLYATWESKFFGEVYMDIEASMNHEAEECFVRAVRSQLLSIPKIEKTEKQVSNNIDNGDYDIPF